MRRDFVLLNQKLNLSEAQAMLESNPSMIVILVDSQPNCILPARDLVVHIDEIIESDERVDSGEEHEHQDFELDLMEIPGMRKDLAFISIQATLLEAVQTLEKNDVEALCITRTSAPMINPVVGILTQNEIDLYSHTPAS